MKNLKGEEINKVDVMLLTSRRLQEANLLKEKFYDFVDSKDLYKVKENLQAWYIFAGSCNLKEFDRCVKTINN